MTDIAYTTARRQRYLTEIGVAVQIGAIIDEIKALRGAAPPGYAGAASFDAVLAQVAEIKAELPKA